MKYNYLLPFTAILLLLNSAILFAQEKDDKEKDKEKEQKENSKWTTGGNKIDDGDWLGTKNNFPLIFKTNKTEYLRLGTNGYFGVGLNNPLVPLHVGGQIRSNFLSGTGFRLLQTDNLGNINSFMGGNSNEVLYGNGIWGELPAPIHWNITGNDMNSIPSGNIGIGTTTSATEKLEVNGNIKANNIILSGSISSQGTTPVTINNLNITNSISAPLITTSIIDSPDSIISFGRNTIKYNTLKNSVYTDNGAYLIQSEKKYNFNTIINSGNTGKVGVGISNPTQLLDVNGATRIRGILTLDAGLSVAGALNAKDVNLTGNLAANCLTSVSMNVSGLSTFDNLNIKHSISAEAITTSQIYAANNNVIQFGGSNAFSVNTLTGNATIAGTLNFASMKMDGSVPNVLNRSLMIDAIGNVVAGPPIWDAIFEPYLGPCGSGITAAGQVQVASKPSWVPSVNTTLNKPIMYLCNPDGFVGIGTTHPEAQLDISTANDVGLNISTHGADYSYGFRVQANKDLTKAISVERPNPGGRKATTTFMVLGNGEVYATDITIQTPAFPDYVFEKNYNLMPLKDLEKYIAINKHLPNIPTAKDIAKSGLSVGKIETSVVEKIEELTLYMIELKKENEALKADLEILKTKIK